MLTFGAGSVAGDVLCIPVSICNDELPEELETFLVVLSVSDPNDAVAAPNTTVISIIDDDGTW